LAKILLNNSSRENLTDKKMINNTFDGNDIGWYNTFNGETGRWESGNQQLGGYMGTLGFNNEWKIEGKGDLNGDGVYEVFVRNQFNNETHIWWGGNMANGRFINHQSLNHQLIGVQDQGSGSSRMIWRNVDNGEVTTWKIDPVTNTMTGTSLGYLSKNYIQNETFLADLDGNGTQSLVSHNKFGFMIEWKDGNSSNRKYIGAVSNDNVLVAVGDFNADGKDDLLYENGPTGQLNINFSGIRNSQIGGRSDIAGVLESNEKFLTVVDIDGNGTSDIITRYDDLYVMAYLDGDQNNTIFLHEQSGDWKTF
jgi:hypothetical protein